MVLNRIRSMIEPLSATLGTTLGKAGVPPDALTVLGFASALVAGVLYGIMPAQPFIAAIFIVLSGIMDVLDGAVARATGKVSRRGSFGDSTLDRLAEIAIFAGIIYGGYGLPALIVLLALAFSLLVSYTRAKADSLNVSISGIGIGERAERLIVLIVFSVAGIVWAGI